MKVGDLMTPDVVTVPPETPLKEAARVLADRGISGMPVVDAKGTLVGVLSEADVVLRAGGERSGSRLLGWLLESDFAPEEKMRAQTAGEAMSAPPITVRPERPIHEAARLMTDEGINRLPVVENERLVGILTRADVVRAFTRSDAEIAEEIENEILRRTLWLGSGSVSVTIDHGEVTIEGEVETDADAELLPVFVSRVPGVTAVRANIHSRAQAAVAS